MIFILWSVASDRKDLGLVRLRIKLLFALFASDAQRPVYGSFLEFGIFDAINIFVSQFSIYATMEADEYIHSQSDGDGAWLLWFYHETGANLGKVKSFKKRS